MLSNTDFAVQVEDAEGALDGVVWELCRTSLFRQFRPNHHSVLDPLQQGCSNHTGAPMLRTFPPLTWRMRVCFKSLTAAFV